MDETTRSEIIRKAATGGYLRCSHFEAQMLLDWLLANGLQYVGANLNQEPRRQKARVRDTSGRRVA
jgi:hypothetical protein